MTSLPPAPSSTGTGARLGSRSSLRPQVGTLRAGRHVMLHDSRAQQVEANNVIAQVRAKVGGDRFRDLDCRKLNGTLSEQSLTRGETATQRACLRSRSALISRFRIIRSTRQVQQALLPGLNTGPTKRKNAGGLDE